MDVKLKLIGGYMPTRSTKYSCGYDVYAPVSGTIKAGDRTVVPLGFCLQPVNNESKHGIYCKLESRSGLALKYGLIVLGGICDSDYTGEYKLIVWNSGQHDFVYNKGDRIAQLLILPYAQVETFTLVRELDATNRGEGGFGSTGI